MSLTLLRRYAVPLGALVVLGGVLIATLHTASDQSARSAVPSCAPVWSLVSSATPGKGSGLLGLAVASPSDLWAVGSNYAQGSTTRQQTLFMRGDGSSWSLYPSVNSGSNENVLNAVDAVSSVSAYAVGSINTLGVQTALVEHWDGSNWTVMQGLPAPSGTGNVLYAVKELADNDVWAVGEYETANAFQNRPLIIHWDGVSWKRYTAPDTGTGSSLLFAVDANGANDVWGVGHFSNGGSLQTLIEHWNGSSWQVVSSPNVGSQNNMLIGIATFGSGDAWAVGDYDTATSLSALVEHWDGASWSVVANGLAPGFDSRLLSVGGSGGSDIWAVGSTHQGRYDQAFAMHFDGSSWSRSSAYTTFGGDNALLSVRATPAGDVWAVGAKAGHTLTEHLCPIQVSSSGMSQATVAVSRGSTVAWSFPRTNSGSHTVVDDSGMGLFTSGSRSPGGSYTFTFDVAGVYPIRDTVTGATGVVKIPITIAPYKGSATTQFRLTWAAASPAPGYVIDVQVQRPGATKYATWQSGTTAITGTFVADAGSGTYYFKARLRRVSNGASARWSGPSSLVVG